MTVETADQNTGGRTVLGVMLFSDPPNGEIIEQFRQMERATERRMGGTQDSLPRRCGANGEGDNWLTQ